jgi:Ca-activated chloride channel family protein
MNRNSNISVLNAENILLVFLFLIISVALNAQTDKKYIRKGNREYGNSKFSESEILYRKAIDNSKPSADAIFNIGDALYKQNKFEDAGKQFIENANLNESKEKKAAGLYNLGNSMLKANKLNESIEAYKNSLKLNPSSKETKFNLAYAQDMLKQQEEQKKQQEKDKKDQKKDDKKQDENKDKNDKNKDQNKDQDNKKDDQQKDQNKDQQQQQSVSKEDAQRLLNALANDEKNVQEKVKLAKAAKEKVKTVKNW